MMPKWLKQNSAAALLVGGVLVYASTVRPAGRCSSCLAPSPRVSLAPAPATPPAESATTERPAAAAAPSAATGSAFRNPQP